MKKFVFIVLVLVLMLAMALPVFARGGFCPPGGPGEEGFEREPVSPSTKDQDRNGNNQICQATSRGVGGVVVIDDVMFDIVGSGIGPLQAGN